MIVNVDVQSAFTLEEEYDSAYSTDPKQMDYINEICGIARSKGLPVVWCYVAYMENGHDCGVRGTRSDSPTALQNIKIGSKMAELDPRLTVDGSRDVIYRKVGASAFFQTHLPSLCVWYGIDTVIVTGGSTSGCIRSTVLDSVQHGYRTIVPRSASQMCTRARISRTFTIWPRSMPTSSPRARWSATSKTTFPRTSSRSCHGGHWVFAAPG